MRTKNKKVFCLFVAGIFLLVGSVTLAQVKVKGYFRKDGTYVRPHWRSKPDSNPYNNYSFPGNYNPYTGKIAPGNPSTYLENYYKHKKSKYPKIYFYPQISKPAQVSPFPEINRKTKERKKLEVPFYDEKERKKLIKRKKLEIPF